MYPLISEPTKVWISAQTLLDIDEMDEVNETDVDLTLEQIENNDSTLTHCCLNNIVSTDIVLFLVPTLYNSKLYYHIQKVANNSKQK